MTTTAAAARRFARLSAAAGAAVIALGAGALASTGQLGAPVAAIAVASSALVAFDPRRLAVPPAVWNAVGATALLAAVYAVVGLRLPVLSVLALLTVFFQLYRLLARRTTLDLRYNFLLAFVQLLLAAILTIELAFLLVFVAFATALVWALLLLYVRAAAEQDGGDGAELARAARLLTAPYLAFATAMTVALLLGTATIFVVLPRLQIGLAEGFAQPVSVSGFSEEVRLGDVGLIQRNAQPVMRVDVRDPDGRPLATPLYHHGLALDTFDGRRWSLGDATTVSLVNQHYGRLESPDSPRGTTHRLRYVLEPLNSRVVFVVRTPLVLDLPLHRLEAASTEGFFFPRGADRPEYTVHARVERPAPDLFRAAGVAYPAEISARYLQLPPLSERVTERARSWISMGDTPYDGALIVQQRLSQGFTYSLDQPSSGADDPIDHFLFESQEGHCEFFATAMAVMLRSEGIPARLVNGFYGGEYNPAGDYTILRQRDAHSWVEVYFPDLGWQIFDPTPIAGFDEAARLRFGSRLRGWFDLAGLRWRTMVLDYDQRSQLDAVERARRRVAAGRGGGSGGGDWRLPRLRFLDGGERAGRGGIGGALAALVLLIALLGGGVALWIALRRRADGDVPADPTSRRFVRVTRRALARLRRSGGAGEGAGATPLELADRFARSDAGGDLDARTVVRRYYAVLYGGRRADRADVAHARRLARAARRGRGAGRRRVG